MMTEVYVATKKGHLTTLGSRGGGRRRSWDSAETGSCRLGALDAKGEGGGPEDSATGGGFPDQICLPGGEFQAANFTLGELTFNVDSVTICILMALKLFISSPDVSQAPVPTSYSLLSPSACMSHKPQLNHRPHAGPSRSFYLGPRHSLGWVSQEPRWYP